MRKKGFYDKTNDSCCLYAGGIQSVEDIYCCEDLIDIIQ